MKRKIFAPIIILLISFSSNAQTTIIKNNQVVATKGYYSIGNNSQKLNTNTSIKLVPTFEHPVVAKGYYSLESNRRKLPWIYRVDTSGRKTTPVRKGYYGIGNNNQKLK